MLPALQEIASLLDAAAASITQPPAPATDATATTTGPGLQEVLSTLETTRKLLAIPDDADASTAVGPAALQQMLSSFEAASRKLLQATTTTNVTQLRQEAKNVLLASDAFGILYTGGNFARAIFALLTPMVVAGQTGVIAVDANYLLNLSQLLAQFTATLGDLLSKEGRLVADGIAPV